MKPVFNWDYDKEHRVIEDSNALNNFLLYKLGDIGDEAAYIHLPFRVREDVVEEIGMYAGNMSASDLIEQVMERLDITAEVVRRFNSYDGTFYLEVPYEVEINNRTFKLTLVARRASTEGCRIKKVTKTVEVTSYEADCSPED